MSEINTNLEVLFITLFGRVKLELLKGNTKLNHYAFKSKLCLLVSNQSMQNKEVKKWAMASILVIVSVLVSSITDNTFHYPIVIVPAIIVISISIGMSVRQKEEDILWKG